MTKHDLRSKHGFWLEDMLTIATENSLFWKKFKLKAGINAASIIHGETGVEIRILNVKNDETPIQALNRDIFHNRKWYRDVYFDIINGSKKSTIGYKDIELIIKFEKGNIEITTESSTRTVGFEGYTELKEDMLSYAYKEIMESPLNLEVSCDLVEKEVESIISDKSRDASSGLSSYKGRTYLTLAKDKIIWVLEDRTALIDLDPMAYDNYVKYYPEFNQFFSYLTVRDFEKHATDFYSDEYDLNLK